jgi:hypothetical protein
MADDDELSEKTSAPLWPSKSKPDYRFQFSFKNMLVLVLAIGACMTLITQCGGVLCAAGWCGAFALLITVLVRLAP